MAQDNSGTSALTRSKPAFSDRALALPDFPGLEFRTALPEGLEWFASPQPVKDFDAASMFTRFERLWLGYVPRIATGLQSGSTAPGSFPNAWPLPRITAACWRGHGGPRITASMAMRAISAR